MTTAVEVDHETLAVVANDLADERVRIPAGWVARVGSLVVAIRDDATVIASKRFPSPDDAEHGFAYVCGKHGEEEDDE
jgi:hypothetical protein